MWVSRGTEIQMTRGDFGIELPITINGATFSAGDELEFRITKNGRTIVEIMASAENPFSLELTEEQSELLAVGTYIYALDWYQNGVFMCNIIPMSLFRVVAKA